MSEILWKEEISQSPIFLIPKSLPIQTELVVLSRVKYLNPKEIFLDMTTISILVHV